MQLEPVRKSSLTACGVMETQDWAIKSHDRKLGLAIREEGWSRKGGLWESWKSNVEVKMNCCEEDQGIQWNLRLDAVLRSIWDKLWDPRALSSGCASQSPPDFLLGWHPGTLRKSSVMKRSGIPGHTGCFLQVCPLGSQDCRTGWSGDVHPFLPWSPAWGEQM